MRDGSRTEQRRAQRAEELSEMRNPHKQDKGGRFRKTRGNGRSQADEARERETKDSSEKVGKPVSTI